MHRLCLLEQGCSHIQVQRLLQVRNLWILDPVNIPCKELKISTDEYCGMDSC